MGKKKGDRWRWELSGAMVPLESVAIDNENDNDNDNDNDDDDDAGFGEWMNECVRAARFALFIYCLFVYFSIFH